MRARRRAIMARPIKPQQTKLFINGAWVKGKASAREKRSQRDRRLLAEVGQATAEQVKLAIDAAYIAFRATYRKAPAYQRSHLLTPTTRGLQEPTDSFV